ncbi:MAG: hypothetical protein WB780_14110 [Candidatus Acidiferrales bacterium]
MTIAIGQRFKDGILLCADTLLSTGGIRKYGDKLFSYRCANGAVIVFAVSGNVAYAKMAIEKSVLEVNKIPAADLKSEAIKIAIEKVLIQFYKDHIFPHPLYKSGQKDFQFVAAAWTPHSGILPFYSTETALTEFEVYLPLGIGSDLAEYILETTAIPKTKHRKLDSAVRLMIHVLWAVKEYVEECGGKSQFIVLDKDGKLSKVDLADIRFVEDASGLWQFVIGGFLVRATDLTLDDQSLRQELGLVYKEIKHLRDKEKQIRKESTELAVRLGVRK